MIIQFDNTISKTAEKQVDSKTKITFHFSWRISSSKLIKWRKHAVMGGHGVAQNQHLRVQSDTQRNVKGRGKTISSIIDTGL